MRSSVTSSLLLAVVCSAGCASSPEPYHVRHENALVSVVLAAPPGTDRAALDALSEDLWAGMAADEETRGLLRRLYSGLPVTLDGGGRPERGASDGIRLRVRDAGAPLMKEATPGASEPREVHLRAERDVVLDVSGPPGVRLHLEALPSGQPSHDELAARWADTLFADLEALRLAAADYLQRKLGAPWTVSTHPSIGEQIDAFCQRYRWSLEPE